MLATHKSVHVVAAVIKNAAGQILIAKRPQHVHQGGLWEFPGGKVEANESSKFALQRELLEELNIQVTDSQPLIQIHHKYPDKSVFLEVRQVTDFSGTVIGNEGQDTLWVDKIQLSDFKFPAANKAIIDATQLPNKYLITPEHEIEKRNHFLETLEFRVKSGIKLLQLRAKSLSFDEFSILYQQVNTIALQHQVQLQVNTSIDDALKLGAKGVHLTSSTLMKTKSLPANIFTSASCHNRKEIEKACELGVRFIVLSPVKMTSSHPDAMPLGWQSFRQLCEYATVPVFALGGMEIADTKTAISSGGQGIAAISSLW